MSVAHRLPQPVAEIWDWQRLGSCRGRGSTQFFRPDGELLTARRRRENRTKALCAGCPVRAECAAHALATREPYGVWGGFTEDERRRLLAIGWQDLADRRRTRVDVSRLGLRLRRYPTVLLPVRRPPRSRPGPARPSSSTSAVVNPTRRHAGSTTTAERMARETAARTSVRRCQRRPLRVSLPPAQRFSLKRRIERPAVVMVVSHLFWRRIGGSHDTACAACTEPAGPVGPAA